METKLAKYEISAVLARSPLSTVYEGWDTGIARRVALKTVQLPHAQDHDGQESLARFRREAQAAGRLQHPNIVAIYDYGETNEVAYIAMEFIDGRSLATVLDSKELLSVQTMMCIMEDVLAGLEYSHTRGVVHRDIKPANIMITSDGRAKIADFGIARIESSCMTQVGTVIGTPAYMSPEQLSGDAADARSDIYSLGVVLYQMLAGKRPFEGGLATITYKALNTDPPRPSQISVQAPPSFDRIVATAMAKAPEKRFPTVTAFADALRDAYESTVVISPRAARKAAPQPRDPEPSRNPAPLQSTEPFTDPEPFGQSVPGKEPNPFHETPAREPQPTREPATHWAKDNAREPTSYGEADSYEDTEPYQEFGRRLNFSFTTVGAAVAVAAVGCAGLWFLLSSPASPPVAAVPASAFTPAVTQSRPAYEIQRPPDTAEDRYSSAPAASPAPPEPFAEREPVPPVTLPPPVQPAPRDGLDALRMVPSVAEPPTGLADGPALPPATIRQPVRPPIDPAVAPESQVPRTPAPFSPTVPAAEPPRPDAPRKPVIVPAARPAPRQTPTPAQRDASTALHDLRSGSGQPDTPAPEASATARDRLAVPPAPAPAPAASDGAFGYFTTDAKGRRVFSPALPAGQAPPAAIHPAEPIVSRAPTAAPPRPDSPGGTASRAGDAPRAMAGDPPRTASGDLSRTASGDNARAAPGGPPRAASGDTPRAASGDTPRAASSDTARAIPDDNVLGYYRLDANGHREYVPR